ncbi:unnamed protein product [Prorocentrum cordatum]|uniref:Protein O-GlcNAc transferase n=1 Tax=Prorocentrum cordatum TaxID=2364126 RepID=A0ABN9YAA1_9DINO|nr:unnamed protein product [Polarella glacialis]
MQLLVLWLCCCAVHFSAGGDASAMLEKAKAQLQRGESAKAEKSLRKVIRSSPHNGEAHNMLCRVRAQLGKFAAAEQSCAEVVRLNPGSGGAFANLAYMQELRGGDALAEAESNYRKALSLEPTNANAVGALPGILQRVGGQLQDLGRDKEAESKYAEAVRLNPKLGSVHQLLGGLQHKRGDLRAAEESYRKATKLSPIEAEAADVFKWLGLLQAARGASEEAISTLRRGVKLRRKSGRPAVSLVMNLGTMGDEHFRQARSEEFEVFSQACASAEKAGNEVASRLPEALKAVRRFEESADWIAPSLVEYAAIFGLSPVQGAYGAVWYPSFRDALAMARARGHPAEDDPGLVVVFGIALGEQCLFAVAAGMRCIGYELLCNSTVQPGRQMVEERSIPR